MINTYADAVAGAWTNRSLYEGLTRGMLGSPVLNPGLQLQGQGSAPAAGGDMSGRDPLLQLAEIGAVSLLAVVVVLWGLAEWAKRRRGRRS